MAKKQKVNTKTLTQSKRRRRRFLTFVRMVRYGINNFSRNAWLTIAATAVMTITLLIIFSTFVARDVLEKTIASVQDKVDMTIYIEHDTKGSTVESITGRVGQLSSVVSVSVSTPEEYREDYIRQNSSNPNTLKSLNNSDAKFPWRIRAKVVDINDTSQLSAFVDEDSELKAAIDETTPPSFAGEYRTAIATIGGWVNFADKAGLIAGIVFVVVSSLIIFNTIRMAIFNRREEIQMMKLIGAERSFIRGPFVVEAVVYGFIAAIIATGLGVFAVYWASPVLQAKGIVVSQTAAWLVTYSPFVLLAMIAIGSFIGIVSSLLATRRYLKI